jgi:CBS domain-containing protein
MMASIVTLPPDTAIREVARVLAGRGISGAPLVEAIGRLLGVVTEGNLARKLATPASGRRGRPATPTPMTAAPATS